MQKTSVLNFGSLNIDLVYTVPHFIRPGETLACSSFKRNAGGKGLNQSVALARAGADVWHAGKTGPDGDFLLKTLADAGGHTDYVLRSPEPSGHAVIEVDEAGGNRILLYPGTNTAITGQEMNSVLDHFPAGTILLLQNEINGIGFLLREARKRGFVTVFNPAPCTPDVKDLPLELVHTLFVNEIEAAQLAEADQDSPPEELAERLRGRLPECGIIITLGSAGALYAGKDAFFRVPAEKVKAVDTTSAGDTFTGYYLASILRGYAPEEAMKYASKASGIAVGRPGAARSIPFAEEVFG